MTKEEYEVVSHAVWEALSEEHGHGRGYSRDAWREAVVGPHGRTMAKIKEKVTVDNG